MNFARVRARQLQGVIWDMDGVLIDSHALHRKAWRAFFQTLGRDIADSELDFILDGRKRGDILRHFLGDYPEAEIEEFGRRKDCIFHHMQTEAKPIPGVLRIVRELCDRSIVLALATSASRSRAQATLARLGVQACFQAIVTGDDVSAGKPAAAVYQLACSRMKIAPQHMLALEDAVAGIHAAVAAGLRCVGVATHETAEKLVAAGAVRVLPDFATVSVDDLESILPQLDSANFRTATGPES